MLAVALGAAGHRPANAATITGQVFIVTPSGDSVKLGLIDVLLVEEKQVTNHLARRQLVLTNELAALRQKLASADAQLGSIRREYGLFQSKSMSPFLAEKAEHDKLASEVTEFDCVSNRQWSTWLELSREWLELSREHDAQLQDFRHAARDPAVGPLGLQARGEWLRKTAAQLDAAGAQLDAATKSRDDTLAGASSAGIGEKRQRLKELEAKLPNLEKSLEAENKGFSEKLKVAARQHNGASDSLAQFPSADFYLSGFVPVPSASALTDPDGKFSLTVPKGGKFAIFAKAQRLVGERTEHYVWFFWLPELASDKPLFLSNRNQVKAGDRNQVLPVSRQDPPGGNL